MSEHDEPLILTDIHGVPFDASALVRACVEQTMHYVAFVTNTANPEMRRIEENAEAFGFYVGMLTAIEAICGTEGRQMFDEHVRSVSNAIPQIGGPFSA